MPPKIFNKSDDEYDIYTPALEKWERSGKLDEQAMAVNMRYDHRVTRGQELKFRRYFEGHGDLARALKEHWDKEIKNKNKPAFCKKICNNFVAFCGHPGRGHCVDFNKDMKLATVINLNGFLLPIRDSGHEVPEWADFMDIDMGAVDFNSNPDVWLDRYMENNYVKKGLDRKNVEPLIDVMFKVINHRLSAGLIYQPIWVTNWDDLEKYTVERRANGSLDADRWNQVVGIPREPQKWQIVLWYPAGVVPCLHRPSILDGHSVYGQHFPTPPRVRKAAGGHTMDLGTGDDKLMSEFIHPQIPLDTKYWINTDRLIGRTLTSGYSRILPSNRSAHHQKLIDHYGQDRIKNWMADPN